MGGNVYVKWSNHFLCQGQTSKWKAQIRCKASLQTLSPEKGPHLNFYKLWELK